MYGIVGYVSEISRVWLLAQTVLSTFSWCLLRAHPHWDQMCQDLTRADTGQANVLPPPQE